MMTSLRSFAFALAVTIVGMAAAAQAVGDDTARSASGLDLSAIDRSIRPGDNFYGYANGLWDARTAIPPDQSRWGANDMLSEASLLRVRALLEEVEKKPVAAADPARKAADFYAGFMDEARIERRGVAPLAAELKAIDAIRTRSDLAASIGHAARDGIDMPIAIGVVTDVRQPNAYAVNLAQGGLGLPDRAYYLDTADPKFDPLRAAYRATMVRLLALAGIADAPAVAARVYAFEAAIAAIQWSRSQTRDADRTYNPVETAAIADRYPGLDWPALLAAAHLSGQPRVIVAQPSALRATARLLESVRLETWRDYLTVRTIAARTAVLPKAFVDQDFAYSHLLGGAATMKPRWRRGVERTNLDLGQAIAPLYVERYFSPAAKVRVAAIAADVRAAMAARIARADWLSPATRAAAQAKLARLRVEIGYPERWRDHTALSIDRGDAYANLVAVARWKYDRDLARLGKPADRGEWRMNPQTVNAYAFAPWNMVVFPAALLQPPFFDSRASDAVNYAAIGAVIGHEISHLFDDQGRKYAADGTLSDWWAPSEVATFDRKVSRLAAQFDAYEPLPGYHIDGRLTLGENLADLVGLQLAHDAWTATLHGRTAPVLDGLSGERQFFLAFAQMRRSKARDAYIRSLLTSDPHTPNNWRPVVVRDLDAWYAAFHVQPADRFYLSPEDRVRIW